MYTIILLPAPQDQVLFLPDISLSMERTLFFLFFFSQGSQTFVHAGSLILGVEYKKSVPQCGIPDLKRLWTTQKEDGNL